MTTVRTQDQTQILRLDSKHVLSHLAGSSLYFRKVTPGCDLDPGEVTVSLPGPNGVRAAAYSSALIFLLADVG